MVTLFMSTLDNYWSDWDKRQIGIHRTGHSIHYLVNIPMGHKHVHVICPVREVYLHISFLSLLSINVLIVLLLRP